MRELKFQTALKKSIENVGGIGIKLNPQWSVGLPDLFLAYDGKQVFLETKVSRKNFELKSDKIIKPKNTSVEINMTPMQRIRLRRLQSAGVSSGWCVAYRMNDDWCAIFGTNPYAKSVMPMHSINIIIRRKYDQWDVLSMINKITNRSTLWDETEL